jgi:hypothetical protein
MEYRTCRRTARCEECEFYDYDEELDTYACAQNLDQDEMEKFLIRHTNDCPYFRYYEEYESTRRQV